MDMRGLAHFIRDIRRATSNKKEEDRRVKEELAKIRAKFVDTSSMSTYDRKKYVCKLMFISMLGYPIVFGHMEGIALMAEETPAEKLIGYLAANILLNESSELLTLTTHTVYRDLMSGDDMNCGLALTAVANTGGKDFAEVMNEGVERVVMDDRVDLHIRKKAVLTLARIYQRCPEVVSIAVIIPKVIDMLECGQDGASMCAATFLDVCFTKQNKHLYANLPSKLVEVIARIVVDKTTEPGYIYYGVPAPWLQISILRLLRRFHAPDEIRLRERILQVLRKILKATEKVIKDAQTQKKQRGTQNRVSAMNAVLLEVVSLGIQWDLGAQFILECASVMGPFIADKREANLRYIGLTMLSRLSLVSPSSGVDFTEYCRQYQQQIIVGIHDSDVSLQKKALEVLIATCGPANAAETINELLSFLPIADDPNFKRSLILAVNTLSEKYCDDPSAYVENLLGVIAQAGDMCPGEVARRLIQVVVSNPSVQKRASTVAFNLLRTKRYVSEILLKVGAFILGEFGYQIALNAESTPQSQYQCLSKLAQYVSAEVQCAVLSALIKFYNLYDDASVRERIARTIGSYKDSNNSEVQQRALEFSALIEYGNMDLFEKVFEPMPTFSKHILSGLPMDGKESQRRSKGKWKGTNEPESNNRVDLGWQPGAELRDLPNHGGQQQANPTNSGLDALFSTVDLGTLDQLRHDCAHSQELLAHVMTHKNGVWFENDTVELRCSQVCHLADCHMQVVVTGKNGAGLVDVSLDVLQVESGLLLQSRSSTTSSKDGAITVEFAARCLGPFRDPPTVSLRYRASSSATPRVEILALPIVAAHFISPYDADPASNYQQLLDNVKSDSQSLSRTLPTRMGTTSSTAVLAQLSPLGYKSFITPGGAVVAVGAHATQRQEKTEFSPIVCEVTLLSGSNAQVTINCLDERLAGAALDLIALNL